MQRRAVELMLRSRGQVYEIQARWMVGSSGPNTCKHVLHDTAQCTKHRLAILPTQMTTKQRYELSWHPGSAQRGQLLDGKNHRNKWEEPPAFNRALQGHSSKQADPRKFAHRLVEKGFAPFLYHLGTANNESSITSDGIVPRGRAHEKHWEMKTQERHRPASSLLCLRLTCRQTRIINLVFIVGDIVPVVRH